MPCTDVDRDMIDLQVTCYKYNIIAVTSHEHHGVSNHPELNSLFNQLFRLTINKTPKQHITGPLWGEIH